MSCGPANPMFVVGVGLNVPSGKKFVENVCALADMAKPAIARMVSIFFIRFNCSLWVSGDWERIDVINVATIVFLCRIPSGSETDGPVQLSFELIKS